eukprot:1313915-Pyramimonas_sp.AAC.1
MMTPRGAATSGGPTPADATEAWEATCCCCKVSNMAASSDTLSRSSGGASPPCGILADMTP